MKTNYLILLVFGLIMKPLVAAEKQDLLKPQIKTNLYIVTAQQIKKQLQDLSKNNNIGSLKSRLQQLSTEADELIKKLQNIDLKDQKSLSMIFNRITQLKSIAYELAEITKNGKGLEVITPDTLFDLWVRPANTNVGPMQCESCECEAQL